jgi:uncharacterized protein
MNEPQDDRLGEHAPAPNQEPAALGSADSVDLVGEERTIAAGERDGVVAESPYAVAASPERPVFAPAPFEPFLQPPPKPIVRIPNFGHLGVLGLLGVIGLVGTGVVLFAASQFQQLGINLSANSGMDATVVLVSEGSLYLFTFAISLLVFPALWHESYFAGIHWRGSVALERIWWLAGTALGCFVLALIDGALLPGPPNAPIEKMFKTPGAAWMMFAFGVTMAPFFEEMFFRGFLLPSLCTAWDWTAEKLSHQPKPPLDVHGHPQWSVAAMVFGSILTSLPFAGIHVEQQGHSIGPFLLLITVSLILCTVRLRTRSLAASTVVHACYNFCIFSVTLIQTSGFRHLDKM